MFKWRKNVLLWGLCLIMPMGCGNRQSSVVPSPVAKISPPVQVVPAQNQLDSQPKTLIVLGPSVRTYKSNPPGIEFDYPADWGCDKAQTACFAICAPKCATPAYSSLSLDIPRLPWHLPGMITVGMVAHGYIDDLKQNQIHDAVVKEEHPITACGCRGREIISQGHESGNVSIDVAAIFIHSDRVYILSADSDQAGYNAAKKTLDAAVASLKWMN